MKFWEDSDRAMEGFDIQLCMRFTREVLNLGQEVKAKDVHSFVCRFGKFSVEVRTQPSSMGIGEDCSPLNPNAKVFKKISAECLKKQGTKDLKQSIGKSQSKKLTGKANALRILDLKQKLSSLRTQVK